jgi:hypothetical protein
MLPSIYKAPSRLSLPTTANAIAGGGMGRISDAPPALPANYEADLMAFISGVSNGESDLMRGVYVPGIFALPIVQQPKNNNIYVSGKNGMITQFASAAKNGVTGLLAHNYLSGRLFYQLMPGQEVLIVYGDGAIQRYRVTEIHRYQKLNPSNLQSNLVELSTGRKVTTSEVFGRFYRGKHHLTFQTCLEGNGRLDWGLTFIVAMPVNSPL